MLLGAMHMINSPNVLVWLGPTLFYSMRFSFSAFILPSSPQSHSELILNVQVTKTDCNVVKPGTKGRQWVWEGMRAAVVEEH